MPHFIILALIVPLLVCAHAVAQDTSGPIRIHNQIPDEATPTPLSTLKRRVKDIGFEEAGIRPNLSIIKYFEERTLDPANGFPPFGTIRETSAKAAAGEWALKFECQGGSMALRLKRGIVPVLSDASYTLNALVCTEGLEYARACISVWLLDEDGLEIPGSRMNSPLLATRSQWQPVSMRLGGNFANAADLQFELLLLQPAHFPNQNHTDDAGPFREDIAGQAWFDDVIIRHAPRIELRTNHPDNLLEMHEDPVLEIRVRDLTNTRLNAKLTIVDVKGEQIAAHNTTIETTDHKQQITLPVHEPGWYRAVLELSDDQDVVGSRTLDFALLAPLHRTADGPGRQFGLDIDESVTINEATLRRLTALSNSGTVRIPLWHDETNLAFIQKQFPELRKLIEHLVATDRSIVFALDRVPADLALAHALDTGSVTTLLALDESVWRPYVDEILINFGLEVDRWRIGNTATAPSQDPAELLSQMKNAHDALARFVPSLVIMTPWSAMHEPTSLPEATGLDIALPVHIRPTSIEASTAHLVAADVPMHIHLDDLRDYHGENTNHDLVDFSQRVLHGWKTQLDTISISEPWQINQDGSESTCAPQPRFVVWRTMTDQLTDRTFDGAMTLQPYVHAWILNGRDKRDGALVAWTDAHDPTDEAALHMVLADGPVVVTNMYGVSWTVSPQDGVHHIPLSDEPLFIERIDIDLARFRSTFDVKPDMVAAEHRAHEVTIELTNTWPVAMTGTLDLDDNPNWQATPGSMQFHLAPGETYKTALRVVFDRNIRSGRHILGAEAILRATREFAVRLEAPFTIGHPDLEMITQWRVEPNARGGPDNLIIMQYVLNKGDQIYRLDGSISGPGIAQRRVVIGEVQPGATAVYRYVVNDGVRILGGRGVRISASDRDGPTRLNHIVAVPDLTGQITPAPDDSTTTAAVNSTQSPQ